MTLLTNGLFVIPAERKARERGPIFLLRRSRIGPSVRPG